MLVIFAVLPILALIVSLLLLKMPIKHAAGVAFVFAAVSGLLIYRMGFYGMFISIGKGLTLALFVLLIIWSAMFLYNLVNDAGAIRVIDRNISNFIKTPFEQFLLLAWVFAPFLQGVAGYGVPVVAVVPILLALGFDPVKTTSAVLIGHSWSICLGSMGTSYYALELVTNLPSGGLASSMVAFVIIALFLTGVTVCAFYGGIKSIKEGLFYLIPASLVMSVSLYILANIQAMSFIGMTTALTGILTILALYHLRKGKTEKTSLYSDSLKLSEAVLPYALIFVLSIICYLLNIKTGFGFDFPGYKTGLDYIIAPVQGYSKILFFKHPAFIILVSSLCGILLYMKKGVVDRKVLKGIGKNTVKKCIPTTITLAFLLSMALIMTDSGMTAKLSEATVALSGLFYPIFSPFIGMLGSFITASSTNSNVVFGGFQESVALQLSMSTSIMCASQIVGASVGGSIGPTTVLMGTTAAKLTGQERLVYKLNLIPALLIVFALGIANMVIMNIF